MNDPSGRAKPLSLNRRQSLGVLAAGLSASVHSSFTHAAEESQMVVDTHLHCFAGPDDSRFPYHRLAPYRPGRAASPEFLLDRMDGAGVDRAIVVHPEPYQDDQPFK